MMKYILLILLFVSCWVPCGDVYILKYFYVFDGDTTTVIKTCQAVSPVRALQWAIHYGPGVPNELWVADSTGGLTQVDLYDR